MVHVFFAVLTNPNPASSQFQRDQCGASCKNNLKAIRNPQNPHRFCIGIGFAFITNPIKHLRRRDLRHGSPICENLYGRQILVSNGSLCFSQGAWGFGFEFCVCSLTHRVHGTGIYIPTFGIKHQPNLGGGFKYSLFSPLLGEMIKFDKHIVQVGWFNHQPEIHGWYG